VLDELAAFMVEIDRGLRETLPGEGREAAIDEGHIQKWKEGLGQVPGGGTQAGAETGRQDDRLHR
jgi:hypothetical protein